MSRLPGSSDLCVQATNDDAQVSKLSCVKLGYFKDDYIRYFVRRPAKRSPLINRGYYSRVLALRQLLEQFLKAVGQSEWQRPQVLSLGAGFDTTFFHMQAQGSNTAQWYEVDFPNVTQKKAAIIAAHEDLQEVIGGGAELSVSPGEGRIVSEAYSLLPADLRDVAALQTALEAAGFRADAPTYVLAECVLVYMEPQESSALVRWLGSYLAAAVFLTYEQIRPDDAFGRQMLTNLEARGCPLKGIHATPNLAAHMRRFTENGWARAEAESMSTIYNTCLDPAEKQRAERLELFDEFEEWHMIQDHYCLVLAVNDGLGLFTDVGFDQLKRLHPNRRKLPSVD